MDRIMEKNQDEHDFGLGHGAILMIFLFFMAIRSVFFHH